MLLSIIFLVLIPVVLVAGTFVLAADDIVNAFRGGNLIGKLFGDLIHILIFWALGILVELWLVWHVVSTLL